MAWVVLAVVFFAIVAGVCLFAGYNLGYGAGAESGFFEGYDAAERKLTEYARESKEEHYLTD